MKNLSNTEAELKKTVACILQFYWENDESVAVIFYHLKLMNHGI